MVGHRVHRIDGSVEAVASKLWKISPPIVMRAREAPITATELGDKNRLIAAVAAAWSRNSKEASASSVIEVGNSTAITPGSDLASTRKPLSGTSPTSCDCRAGLRPRRWQCRLLKRPVRDGRAKWGSSGESNLSEELTCVDGGLETVDRIKDLHVVPPSDRLNDRRAQNPGASVRANRLEKGRRDGPTRQPRNIRRWDGTYDPEAAVGSAVPT